MKLTTQDVDDIIRAIQCARDELCAGENFPEAIEALYKRWTVLQERFEKYLHPVIINVGNTGEETGGAYTHDINRTVDIDKIVAARIAAVAKAFDVCAPVFPDACLEGRWAPRFYLIRKRDGLYRVIADNMIQDSLRPDQAAARAWAFYHKLKAEKATRDFMLAKPPKE